MGEQAKADGPDFARGVKLADIAEGASLSGRVGDEPVLLSKIDGSLFAVSATCTHYGGDLAKGLTRGASVRCPLHHACFSLRTGEVLRGPALDPVARWTVEVEDDRAFVREKLDTPSREERLKTDVEKVLIVGGGAAGLACANRLRKLGYEGAITILSADRDAPYDRPNLSKDYLAGTAPEEWIPLRSQDWYRENRIDLRLGVEVASIDPDTRTVDCSTGEHFAYDRLLLATGSEPNKLSSPGFERDNVFTLRSLADARALAGHARSGARAAVIGSSFIGLEAAAALRHRKVEVEVISPEKIPFERVLGPELGAMFKALHEENGVRFHLGRVAATFDGKLLRLSDGEEISADLVLVGIGVKPRIGLAEAAGLTIADGVAVDACLRTSAPDIYAAGDIAAYPDPLTGERVRIEHWVVALRQGEVAAENMLGAETRFDSPPFFWTEQYGLALRYVGHAPSAEDIRVDGNLVSRDATVRYYQEGQQRAAASINRDRENLDDEVRLEQQAR